jgi:FtsH-binding integral membrane protein
MRTHEDKRVTFNKVRDAYGFICFVLFTFYSAKFFGELGKSYSDKLIFVVLGLAVSLTGVVACTLGVYAYRRKWRITSVISFLIGIPLSALVMFTGLINFVTSWGVFK